MDADDATPSVLTVRLRASSERYDDDDARWREQVTLLVGALRHELGTVEVVSEPEPGSKGGAEAIILALGSAGAFSVALEVFRAWLGRERTRSLSITLDRAGVQQQFTVRATHVDRDGFRELTEFAIRRGLHV